MQQTLLIPLAGTARANFEVDDPTELRPLAGGLPQESSPHAVLVQIAAQSLRTTGYAALRNLTIGVVAGRIVLSGRVRTYYQKQLAQSIVQRLQPAGGITNDIEVRS